MHFQPIFLKQPWITQRLEELEPPRNIVAHSNPLSKQEENRVDLYFNDWIALLNDRKAVIPCVNNTEARMAETEELLRFIVQLTARHVFPEDVLRQIVGSSGRQVEAYNLCDGTRTQAEIAKASISIQGNSVEPQVDGSKPSAVQGRNRSGRQAPHLYPLSAVQASRRKKDSAD